MLIIGTWSEWNKHASHSEHSVSLYFDILYQKKYFLTLAHIDMASLPAVTTSLSVAINNVIIVSRNEYYWSRFLERSSLNWNVETDLLWTLKQLAGIISRSCKNISLSSWTIHAYLRISLLSFYGLVKTETTCNTNINSHTHSCCH